MGLVERILAFSRIRDEHLKAILEEPPATRFRNNELHRVTAVEAGKIALDSGELPNWGALHLDQGIVVTSHASQGKTVAQVSAFEQAKLIGSRKKSWVRERPIQKILVIEKTTLLFE